VHDSLNLLQRTCQRNYLCFLFCNNRHRISFAWSRPPRLPANFGYYRALFYAQQSFACESDKKIVLSDQVQLHELYPSSLFHSAFAIARAKVSAMIPLTHPR
jgi:hypothetical protein